MKFARIAFLLLAALALAGCDHSVPPPIKEGISADEPEPTAAQPKLSTIRLYLGAETIEAEQALTMMQERIGMMFRTNIQETDAMIFVLPIPQRASFWMKNCPESISCAYISPEGVIREIHHLEKNDTVPVVATNDDIQFVLETSDGWFDRHHINPGAVIFTDHGTLYGTYFHRPAQ